MAKKLFKLEAKDVQRLFDLSNLPLSDTRTPNEKMADLGEFWKELGKRYGFIPETAESTSQGESVIAAEPVFIEPRNQP